MRIHFHRLANLIFAAILLVSCTAPAAPANVPNTPAGAAPVAAVSTSTAVPESGVPANWQTYTNPAGFSIQYPSTWTQQQLPDQYDGTLHTVSLQGTEGHVDLQWGAGFGGACPQGYTTVKVAQGELPACYTKNADGTETWTQINKELSSTTGFSGMAATNNADPASHDLVLQVVSTLSFSSWP